ncbi:SDR family oxidoreductase [Spiractinospora alimapuensis]|uniref:SDR family oxidoreductase n=1 Tax=Spiractinospora alimapuensis TaxID=2820884 RepID=UPI001F27F46B|nr:SDR family oxidoreductase [Spiractinospora alimapuensis]QVQ54262.1 SDR family oxidoreductase [Spiractinospora alimapuensis]
MADPGTETRRLVLVTGATGYIGGRLVPELLDAGYQVRCMARSPEKLRDHPWRPQVEVARGDVVSGAGLKEALSGVRVAYYLVHSMGGGAGFGDRDLEGASAFARAAADAGIERIVYLGGLAPGRARLSAHMASRSEVGAVFLRGEVPAVVLRAAVIIGSGSASFEMLRYLTERLPVMTTPRWVRSRVQPIAIRDVLRLLIRADSLPEGTNRIIDIGGPDVLTYADMVRRYARIAGLRPRLIIPLPMLSPGLSSMWVGLVTPVPPKVARPLVESLRHDAVVGNAHDQEADDLSPGGELGFDRAVELAIRRTSEAQVDTRWSSATGPALPSDPLPGDPDWSGGSTYVDERSQRVVARAMNLWRVVEAIGGENGWYSWPLAWAARGWIDLAVGGVGAHRGRRDRRYLRVGDSVDFWRVEEVIPGELLRLRAEMRLPGRAWLELRVERDHPADEGPNTSVYRQRALFRPIGLLGHLYWAVVTPLHGVVFGSMVRGISKQAERLERMDIHDPPPNDDVN